MTTGIKTKQFDGLCNESIALAREIIKDMVKGNLSNENLRSLRNLSSIINGWVDNKRADTGVRHMNFVMAIQLSEDKEQLREYLRLWVPDTQLLEPTQSVV